MRYRLILEEFGPDIQNISKKDNIVADAISRMPTANTDQREPSTEVQGLSSETLAELEQLVLEDDESFPLQLYLVQKIIKELNTKSNKLRQSINDKKSGYHIMTLETSRSLPMKIEYMFHPR